MTRATRTIAFCLLMTVPLASADFPVGPGAPTDLAAAAGPGAGEISLSWGPAQSLTGVTSYNVYRLNEDGSHALVGSTDAVTTTFVDAGLGNGVTTSYVVTAVDVIGEGPASGSATATTFTTPSAPENVVATPGAIGTVGEIAVSWSAPLSDGGLAVTSYNVYRDGALVATVGADALSWTDAGRAPGEDNVYAVTAVNGAGESEMSATSCAMASPWAAELGCLGLA